jgi:hypothetical protein
MHAQMTSYATPDLPVQNLLATMPKRIKINPILFGKLVASHRRHMRMSQQDLARYIFKDEDLSDSGAQSRMSRIESGKVKVNQSMVNRVSKLFHLPVPEIHQMCIDNYIRLKNDLEFSLRFEPSIIDYMPTIENYIQIINTHLKEDNIKGVALGFQQLCEAASCDFNVDNCGPDPSPDDDKANPSNGVGS